MIRCPACYRDTVSAQDIEALSDSALLVKTDNRFQLCCQSCGWMGFADPAVEPGVPGVYREGTSLSIDSISPGTHS